MHRTGPGGPGSGHRGGYDDGTIDGDYTVIDPDETEPPRDTGPAEDGRKKIEDGTEGETPRR